MTVDLPRICAVADAGQHITDRIVHIKFSLTSLISRGRGSGRSSQVRAARSATFSACGNTRADDLSAGNGCAAVWPSCCAAVSPASGRRGNALPSAWIRHSRSLSAQHAWRHISPPASGASSRVRSLLF